MDRGPGDGGADNSALADFLYAYAALFFAVAAFLAWFDYSRKRNILLRYEKLILWGLVGCGLFIRLWLASMIEGHPGDMRLFQQWASAAGSDLLGFYTNVRSCDYPPLYIYVLALVGKMTAVFKLSSIAAVLLKLPSMLADLVIGWLIYLMARRNLTGTASLLVSALYLLNPAVLMNSAVWGQADCFFTLLIVGAVYCLCEKRMALSAVFFAAAVLMKPQGIIFLPVLCYEILRERSLVTGIKAMAAALTTAAVIALPFALQQGPRWIFELYAVTVGEYPFAALNACNLFGLLGANYVNDGTVLMGLSYHTWGMIFIVAVSLVTGLLYWRSRRDGGVAALAALYQIAGVFMLSTRMHERYLLPAVALAVFAYLQTKDHRLLWVGAGFSITSFLNTHLVLFQSLNGGGSTGLLFYTVSALNVCLFGWLTAILLSQGFAAVQETNRTSRELR